MKNNVEIFEDMREEQIVSEVITDVLELLEDGAIEDARILATDALIASNWIEQRIVLVALKELSFKSPETIEETLQNYYNIK